jgi:hypothetical protein
MNTLQNETHHITTKEVANVAIKQYNIPDKNAYYVRNTITACLSY